MTSSIWPLISDRLVGSRAHFARSDSETCDVTVEVTRLIAFSWRPFTRLLRRGFFVVRIRPPRLEPTGPEPGFSQVVARSSTSTLRPGRRSCPRVDQRVRSTPECRTPAALRRCGAPLRCVAIFQPCRLSSDCQKLAVAHPYGIAAGPSSCSFRRRGRSPRTSGRKRKARLSPRRCTTAPAPLRRGTTGRTRVRARAEAGRRRAVPRTGGSAARAPAVPRTAQQPQSPSKRKRATRASGRYGARRYGRDLVAAHTYANDPRGRVARGEETCFTARSWTTLGPIPGRCLLTR